MNYSVTITKTGRSACVRVSGDLDYETADEVVEAASQLLARQVELMRPAPRLQRTDIHGLSGPFRPASAPSPHHPVGHPTASRSPPGISRPGTAGDRALRPFRCIAFRLQPAVSEPWPVNQAFAELSVRLTGPVSAGRSQNVTKALPNRSGALTLPTFRTCLRSLLQPHLLKEWVHARGL